MWKLAEDIITQDELDKLADWLKKGPARLSQGPLVKEFEKKWAQWVGVKDSLMVSSGTTANMAIIMAATDFLGKDASEIRVGVSAVTWITNWSPSLLMGSQLVVFDVDKDTLGASKEQVKEAIKNNEIDIYFATHLLGFNCLDQEILDLAEEHGVMILSDVCESAGAKMNDVKVGSLGMAATYSFYISHHMCTIEGGAIASNNPEFLDLCRMSRAHGLARESNCKEDHEKNHPNINPQFLFINAGLNFRSTDVNAFLGLSQLGKVDQNIKIRNENLDLFLSELKTDKIWKDYKRNGASSFALPMICEDEDTFSKVNEVIEKLGIESRPVVGGNLLVQPFAKKYSSQITAKDTPNADHIQKFGVYLGNGPHVTEEKIKKLIDELNKIGL